MCVYVLGLCFVREDDEGLVAVRGVWRLRGAETKGPRAGARGGPEAGR